MRNVQVQRVFAESHLLCLTSETHLGRDKSLHIVALLAKLVIRSSRTSGVGYPMAASEDPSKCLTALSLRLFRYISAWEHQICASSMVVSTPESPRKIHGFIWPGAHNTTGLDPDMQLRCIPHFSKCRNAMAAVIQQALQNPTSPLQLKNQMSAERAIKRGISFWSHEWLVI